MYDVMKGKSPVEQDDIRASARSLVHDPAFKAACEKLHHEYVQALLAEPVGSLTAATVHASMKVLEQVRHELSLFVADERFQQRNRR